MTSEKLQTKIPPHEFQGIAYYFGIAIQPVSSSKNLETSYIDIEQFFLSATYNLKTSRAVEGFLCWLLQFGHLLSPSKIRRLIQSGQVHDSAMLGSFIEFLVINKIRPLQWKIVKPFCKKKNIEEQLLGGPTPRLLATYFLKYGIIAPQFKFDRVKFLRPTKAIFKNCLELKNRALFGSVVNADAVSYLTKHSESTAYQIAKATHHHKAGVFAIYADVLAAS
ncbi:MAG: hypothetical protein IPK04_05780 [Bdellovibrionales bacterium]|jgi:hypothetical protein|nr:hypothetical protein [Bdellovibrionales bacterium]